MRLEFCNGQNKLEPKFVFDSAAPEKRTRRFVRLKLRIRRHAKTVLLRVGVAPLLPRGKTVGGGLCHPVFPTAQSLVGPEFRVCVEGDWGFGGCKFGSEIAREGNFGSDSSRGGQFRIRHCGGDSFSDSSVGEADQLLARSCSCRFANLLQTRARFVFETV